MRKEFVKLADEVPYAKVATVTLSKRAEYPPEYRPKAVPLVAGPEGKVPETVQYMFKLGMVTVPMA